MRCPAPRLSANQLSPSCSLSRLGVVMKGEELGLPGKKE